MPFSTQNRLLYTVAQVLLWLFAAQAQEDAAGSSLWQPADSLNKKRLCIAGGAGLVCYGAATTALHFAWYREYERSRFHTFSDWGHWAHMDKWGHLFANYAYSYMAFGAARWTGMRRGAALLTAAGCSMLLQTTVELMDGFSARWGYSWPDMAFNLAGTALFAGQEWLWREQRIRVKVSNHLPAYDARPVFARNRATSSSAADRARELYGRSLPERLLKDYNGTTIWFSVNPAAFRRGRALLPWLNLAFGLGAGNLYGARNNRWEAPDGAQYSLQHSHPRYRQFYLSLDVDLRRIPTQSSFLRFLLGALNWIKIPAPALEYNTRGQWRFHPLFW